MMENAVERLTRYLQDAHATEAGNVTMLTKFRDRAVSDETRLAFQSQVSVTLAHVERVKQHLSALGAETSEAKDFFGSLGGFLANAEMIGHDQYDKGTQDLVASYISAHVGVASYLALREFATVLGRTDTASLAANLLTEKESAAKSFLTLIEKAGRRAISGVAGQGSTDG